MYKVIAALIVVTVLVVGIGQSGKNGRSYVAGRFMFILDGASNGFLKQVDGGGIKAEVISEVPQGAVTKKHISNVKYEDITVRIGVSQSKAIYDWISASWSGKAVRKNGSIIAADFDYDALSQRDFVNALITETGIPACDGSSKEPAYLTVKFTPETLKSVKAGGKIDPPPVSKQKNWLPSNFRLTIDGLDCTKVSKIDSFTIKQAIIRGDPREPALTPGPLELPTMRITLSQSSAQTWYDYFEDFVIKGNAGDNNEKKGTLEFLGPDLKAVLAQISFSNLGIFSLVPDDGEANSDNAGRVTAELYCESMAIKLVATP